MPYISASIVMQLAAIAVPSMQKLQREGESGRRKINQWTRYLTVIILLLQAPTYLISLNVQLGSVGSSLPRRLLVPTLCNGYSCRRQYVCLWLGERITDKGMTILYNLSF